MENYSFVHSLVRLVYLLAWMRRGKNNQNIYKEEVISIMQNPRRPDKIWAYHSRVYVHFIDRILSHHNSRDQNSKYIILQHETMRMPSNSLLSLRVKDMVILHCTLCSKWWQMILLDVCGGRKMISKIHKIEVRAGVLAFVFSSWHWRYYWLIRIFIIIRTRGHSVHHY